MYEVLFFSALVLSLIFCGMPGAVNTQALRVGVTGGLHRTFGVETGSIVGDMTWAVIALVGLAFVWENDIARFVLGVLGGTILVYLAYHGFQDARRKDMPEHHVLTGRSDFMTGVVISFVNPFQIPFWIGIGSSAIAVIIPEPQLMDFVIFYLGYFTGAVIWGTGYSVIIGYGRRFVTPKLFRGISFVCALVMMYFAVSLLWNTFLT